MLVVLARARSLALPAAGTPTAAVISHGAER
jgi:hypothetical protein